MRATPEPELQGGGSADQAHHAHKTRLAAIGLMCLAVLLFAFLDTTAKWLGRSYDPWQVVWMRYASHLVIAMVAVNPLTTPGAWRTKRPVLQFVRSILLALSTLFNFMALQTLQLDQAITITFATPFLVAVLAGPLLGEWIGPRRLAAILVGLMGVVLVTQPGFGEWKPAYLLSIAAALTYALYNITTRLASHSDSSLTSFVVAPLFGAIVLAPAMVFAWTTPATLFDWILFVSTGVWGGVGHLLLIMAHGRAPAPILAPFMYTELVTITLLGFLVFGDVPDVWTLAGAAIVIGAGLYLLARERVGRRPLKPGAAPG